MYQTMNSIEIGKYLSKMVKTSELIKMLAEVELKNGSRFTAAQLATATIQTNTNDITRKDIEVKKATLIDAEYQSLQAAIHNMCNAYVAHKTEGTKQAIKVLVKLKDDCYDRVVNQFS